jgi:hypothetical protein
MAFSAAFFVDFLFFSLTVGVAFLIQNIFFKTFDWSFERAFYLLFGAMALTGTVLALIYS